MAVPQRRTSKTRKRKRRTHFKITAPGMMVCPNCGEMKLSHRVCKSCGHYHGRIVIEQKDEELEEDAA
ncbi:MAG: 50S ribosomal protein L32 [Acholeplasmatales bacterium]|nr:MAG: 50S ribosomal protein L32 [Acholeplasmatales bacterium]